MTMTDDTATQNADVPVKSGVTPYLTVDGAGEAADFYVRTFGAEIKAKMESSPGRFIHIHLYINDGSVMLSDPAPEQGHPFVPLQGFNLHIQTDEPQRWYDRAAAAGCEVLTPMQRMFWGDMYGQLKDRWGVTWAIGGK